MLGLSTDFHNPLSPRQVKMARLVAEGMKNKEIAPEIGTTENVVKNYLRKIYDLTGMSNRTELALWYIAHCETPESEKVKEVRGHKYCRSCGSEL